MGQMPTKDLPIQELIRSLELAGEYPDPELVEAIWNQKEEAAPILRDVFREAYSDDWPPEQDPRWFQFLHAGKFLLAWQVEEAIPIFA
jgi:hypothetical protein